MQETVMFSCGLEYVSGEHESGDHPPSSTVFFFNFNLKYLIGVSQIYKFVVFCGWVEFLSETFDWENVYSYLTLTQLLITMLCSMVSFTYTEWSYTLDSKN